MIVLTVLDNVSLLSVERNVSSSSFSQAKTASSSFRSEQDIFVTDVLVMVTVVFVGGLVLTWIRLHPASKVQTLPLMVSVVLGLVALPVKCCGNGEDDGPGLVLWLSAGFVCDGLVVFVVAAAVLGDPLGVVVAGAVDLVGEELRSVVG